MADFHEKLESLGFKKYADYLKSPHWQELKRRYIARKCYACNGYPCQLHHRTYIRLGCELPNDLVSLCGDCHTATHDLVDEGIATLADAADVVRQTVQPGSRYKKQRRPRQLRPEEEKARREKMAEESRAKYEREYTEQRIRREELVKFRNETGHDPSSPFRHIKVK